MKPNISVPALLLAVLLASCTGTPRRSAAVSDASAAATAAGAATATAAGSRELVIPAPSALLSDDAKLEYLSEHYWDNMDFADAGWLADTASLERAYAGWLDLLRYLPAEAASERACALLRVTAPYPDFLQRFLEISETWLATPGSPLYDEERYIPLLETTLALPDVDETLKLRPREQLAQAQKNRRGSKAADLHYITGSGRRGRLYDLRGEYTLLMFYAPDCPTCAAWEEHASGSELFKGLLSSGRLSVLAVCTESDEELWRAHLAQMPAGWTVGRSPMPDDVAASYHLIGTPSLYLLDRGKHVVLKNPSIFQAEAWLAEHTAAPAPEEHSLSAKNVINKTN